MTHQCLVFTMVCVACGCAEADVAALAMPAVLTLYGRHQPGSVDVLISERKQFRVRNTLNVTHLDRSSLRVPFRWPAHGPARGHIVWAWPRGAGSDIRHLLAEGVLLSCCWQTCSSMTKVRSRAQMPVLGGVLIRRCACADELHLYSRCCGTKVPGRPDRLVTHRQVLYHRPATREARRSPVAVEWLI